MSFLFCGPGIWVLAVALTILTASIYPRAISFFFVPSDLFYETRHTGFMGRADSIPKRLVTLLTHPTLGIRVAPNHKIYAPLPRERGAEQAKAFAEPPWLANDQLGRRGCPWIGRLDYAHAGRRADERSGLIFAVARCGNAPTPAALI